MAKFGERLKELRNTTGETQKDMAQLLGLKYDRTYRQYELGKIDPPSSKAQKLADHFGVSLDYLFGRTDGPKPLTADASPILKPESHNLNNNCIQSNTRETLAIRLKQCRKEKRLTQYQVAMNCGITPTAYQNYELMHREPKLEILLRIADFFDVSLDYLTGRTDDPKRH